MVLLMAVAQLNSDTWHNKFLSASAGILLERARLPVQIAELYTCLPEGFVIYCHSTSMDPSESQLIILSTRHPGPTAIVVKEKNEVFFHRRPLHMST